MPEVSSPAMDCFFVLAKHQALEHAFLCASVGQRCHLILNTVIGAKVDFRILE